MFEAKEQKKLIIVCDDKTKEYANYLMALISASDDSDGRIIGIEDGTVEAVVWTEKQFKDNEPTLSSKTRVLFIGNNKTTKAHLTGMEKKFERFGIGYGWLGKRAVMLVDRPIYTKLEYEEFLKFASDYQKDIKKLLENNEAKEINREEMSTVDEKHIGKSIAKGVSKGTLYIVGALVNPLIPVALVAKDEGPKLVANIRHKKEINDQQYKCLTMLMYLEGLKPFMED